VSPGSGLGGARIAGPPRMLEQIASREPGLVIAPRIHSLALRMVRGGTGDIEAAVAGANAHDWDLAAADVVVHEAGGALTSLDGNCLIYTRSEPVHGVLLATGRERHAALMDLLLRQADERAQ